VEGGASGPTFKKGSWMRAAAVGYGDKYPVSMEGRAIATVLMFCGVGLFGTLSGVAASMVLGNRSEQSTELGLVLARLRELEKRLPTPPPQDVKRT
jgi:voltage-gated potassium channel